VAKTRQTQIEFTNQKNRFFCVDPKTAITGTSKRGLSEKTIPKKLKGQDPPRHQQEAHTGFIVAEPRRSESVSDHENIATLTKPNYF
jgi:hypothetical protein